MDRNCLEGYTPSCPSSSKSTLPLQIAVAAWYTSNIGVLLLNKYLLNIYGFRYALLLRRPLALDRPAAVGILSSNIEPLFHLFGFIVCVGSTAGRALKSVVQACKEGGLSRSSTALNFWRVRCASLLFLLTGEILYTFTIITTSSSKGLQWLHGTDRMPVILGDEVSTASWFNGLSSKLDILLKPYEHSDLVITESVVFQSVTKKKGMSVGFVSLETEEQVESASAVLSTLEKVLLSLYLLARSD